MDYDKAFAEVKTALGAAFWGPPASGVYSPSVQYTLFQMAKLALERCAPSCEMLTMSAHMAGLLYRRCAFDALMPEMHSNQMHCLAGCPLWTLCS